MRRFSQRNAMVTLSDINITPLLDLAFVLLIIFIITTPLLTQSIDMQLSKGGKPDKPLSKNDIKTVEITSSGVYHFEGRAMQLQPMIAALAEEHRSNPNLVVYIRGDRASRLDLSLQVIDACEKNGITRCSFRTDPTRTK